MTKTFVVDQNVMQRGAILDFIRDHPTARLVIPDTGFVEMVKSERWEETFKYNFRALVPVVTRCYMSVSVQEARTLELLRKRLTRRKLLPGDFTRMLRGAILESQSGDGPTLNQLRARMIEVRSDLGKHDLNAHANREELENRIDELRRKLTEEKIKACRNNETGRAARVLVAQSVGDAIFKSHMSNLGVPPDVSLGIWQSKGATRRWCYLLAHQALQWLGDGGLDSASDKAILNDILDQDYVLLGSMFDGVVSLEPDVNCAVADLKAMLMFPPSANAPTGAC